MPGTGIAAFENIPVQGVYIRSNIDRSDILGAVELFVNHGHLRDPLIEDIEFAGDTDAAGDRHRSADPEECANGDKSA